jgi:hypothetical protein
MSAKRPEILYIERKNGIHGAEAHIGRVTYSKSGQTIYYRGSELRTANGAGFKYNYLDVETGDEYWISGCKKRGGDALYPVIIEVDEDVREEYWTEIRNKPAMKNVDRFKCMGKYGK